MALRQLPAGTGYAVRVGIGAVGVVAAGIILFDEGAGLVRLLCLASIIAGMVGLRLVEG